MSEIKRPRRYYLLKRLRAQQFCDIQREIIWQAKQEDEIGTPLPDGFPSRAALVAVGYSAVEDIDGADCLELRENVGLSESQAKSVIAAVALLV